MGKRSFLKRYFTYSLKYFFDLSYLIIVSIISALVGLIEVLYTKINWLENLSTYQVSYPVEFNIFDAGIEFFVVFFVSFFVFLLFRFFSNFLLFKSKRTIQELISIIFGNFYLFVSFHFLFKFGFNESKYQLQGKILNFIVIVFFVFSFLNYLFRNKLFYISNLAKKISVIIIMFILLFIDWFIVNYYKNVIDNKLNHQEFYFLFYHADNKLLSQFQSIYKFENLTSVVQFQEQNKNAVYSNVGDPLSSRFLIDKKNKNICKNEKNSLKNYNLYKFIMPILNFAPNRVSVLLFEDLYCLNLGKDYPEIFRYSVYKSIIQNNQENSKKIFFINLNNYEFSGKEIINQFETLFNTFSYIKDNSKFFVIQDN